MDIVRWLILLGLITFCFGVYRAEAAPPAAADVYLDELTVQRGYTVKSLDRQLWVPIFARQFARPVRVIISQVENDQPLPERCRTLTGFYQVDVENEKAEPSVSPVLLSFAYDVDGLGSKAVFYFDKNKNSWSALPSQVVDAQRRIIQAWMPLPHLRVVVLENLQDDLTAKSALLLDEVSGQVIFEKDAGAVRKLASLTKLMTALVFLKYNPGWDKSVTLQASDYVGGTMLDVPSGAVFSVKDLFQAMLVGSKNNAAAALARSTGLTTKDFVAEMNSLAESWGLDQTRFSDVAGLSASNVSTVGQVARLAERAFADNDIRSATTTVNYELTEINSGRKYLVANTSGQVLQSELRVLGSKTGTSADGTNLVTRVVKDGRLLLATVMECAYAKNQEEVYRLLTRNF